MSGASDISITEDLKEDLSVLRIAMGRGLLSAMIGAGFSFNAEEMNSSASRISWQSLGDRIEATLYALRGKPVPAKDPAHPFDARDVLKVAQEYKETIAGKPGEKSLDDLIYEISSYEDFRPGSLHRELLALHWSDVFTTNYDRLLERTLEEERQCEFPLVHKQYNLVLQGTELPGSKPAGIRRIIKLHGSFPVPGSPADTGVKPYLLADDDYAAYPVTHKLLVQEVQRSLVNETFCLIGFSGTDPNFKSWVSWVTEALKDNRPKVYLIDFKDPGDDDKAFFEENNIAWVNIAPLAGHVECENNTERQKALHSFFGHLKVEAPEEPLWSYSDLALRRAHPLGPVEFDQYLIVASALRRKRESYPGWVFPPLEVLRNAKWFLIFHVPSCLALLSLKRDNTDRLAQFLISYEYLWAYDTFCLPADLLLEDTGLNEMVQLVEELWSLQNDGVLEKRLLALPESIRIDADGFVAMLRDAMRVIMGLYRRYGASEAFSATRKMLDERLRVRPDAEIAHWSLYHAALREMEMCNPEGAAALIDDWQLDDGALYWKTRKANLLAELERTEEAKTLLLDSLFGIREQIRTKGESAFLLSCEVWTERFLEVLIQQISRRKPLLATPEEESSKDGNEMLSRTPVLRRLAFHPFQILQGLGEEMRIRATTRPMGEPALEFTTGSETEDRHMLSGLLPGLHEAHAVLGMIEKVGLPPRIDNPAFARINTTLWINAATVLFRASGHFHYTIFPLMHRMCDPDALKENCVLFSRYALTRMDSDRVYAAFDAAFGRLRQIADLCKTDSNSRGRNARYACFLTRYIGRLAPILDNDRLSKALREMLYWYETEAFFFGREMADAFLESFSLVVKATPQKVLTRYLRALMVLPLAPVSMRNAVLQTFFTPIRWRSLLSGRTLRREDLDWDDIALRLLEDLQCTESWLDGQPRVSDIGPANAVHPDIAKLVDDFRAKNLSDELAAKRIRLLQPYWDMLLWLRESDLLTEKSVVPVSAHVWRSGRGAPDMTGFKNNVACVFFPDTDRETCFATYKRRWFDSLEAGGSRTPTDWLNALSPSLAEARLMPLSDEELKTMLIALHETPIPAPVSETLPGRHVAPSLSSIIDLLQRWGQRGLARADGTAHTPKESWIYLWLLSLREKAIAYGYSSATLDILLLEFAPEKSHELAETLRENLFTGPLREFVGEAVFFWKYYFSAVVPYPEEHEGMVADAFRNSLPPASMELLTVLLFQLETYRANLSERETNSVVRGLEQLYPLLQYGYRESELSPGELPPSVPLPLKIPYHRERVARFLRVLLRRHPSLRQHKPVAKWIENLLHEPLADIRNILE